MKLREQIPAGMPDYMIPAWVGCLHWAIGDAGVRESFSRETGISFNPPATVFDRMIDEAAGFDAGINYIESFIPWFNANIWGPTPIEVHLDGKRVR